MLTFLGSGSVPIVMLTGVGQCVVTATGVEHPGLILFPLLLLGILVGVEAVAKALWVETLLVVLAMCRLWLGNRVSSCSARCWDRNSTKRYRFCCVTWRAAWRAVAPPSKEERTKEREQLLWEKVQSQNRLRKQEAGHVEQIAKLEADAAKQRAMLQSVREQLKAVNDEVCAFRALVADPSVPTGPTPEPPPLPAPQRVTAALHGHHIACGTHLSQNSYSVHDACGVWNSENSRGDTEVGEQHFCVHGETKSLSMCTRAGVRRPAVEKLASPQQASLKLHEETWAGLLQNRVGPHTGERCWPLLAGVWRAIALLMKPWCA